MAKLFPHVRTLLLIITMMMNESSSFLTRKRLVPRRPRRLHDGEGEDDQGDHGDVDAVHDGLVQLEEAVVLTPLKHLPLEGPLQMLQPLTGQPLH